jgi:hypothetical protein
VAQLRIIKLKHPEPGLRIEPKKPSTPSGLSDGRVGHPAKATQLQLSTKTKHPTSTFLLCCLRGFLRSPERRMRWRARGPMNRCGLVLAHVKAAAVARYRPLRLGDLHALRCVFSKGRVLLILSYNGRANICTAYPGFFSL